MPNNVVNTISFVCEEQEFKDIIKKYWSSNEEPGEEGFLDFNKIIPIPSNIYMGNLGPEEFDKYPNDNWYSWCIKNWGTKWNSYYGSYDIDSKTIRFETAWSAPHPIIEKLGKLTKAFFVHEWADEDIGQNTGHTVCVDGKCTEPLYNENGSDAAYELALSLHGCQDNYRKVKGEWVYAYDT